MQYFWLNKKENEKIIVFFNGWAMNETAVRHLNCCDFDILILSDYRNFDFDFEQFNFEKYKEKYLVCWSMGVYCVNLFKKYFDNFDKKIAINGTTKMINNLFGIPEKIYKITIKLFSEESCDKFISNIFNEKIDKNIKITRTLEELKEELVSIQNIILKEEVVFDKAIISLADKIVPTKNQIAFWENKSEIVKINAPHYPFKNFKSWDELLC